VTTYRPGRPLEHVTTPPEWTCPACGRSGPLEVDEQLPNDVLTRCRRIILCRYEWKVPRDLVTVTCPRCYTSQPAAHVNS
jgi:ssDNA-binding Zn-finger/Zn-ribbon topoisomerase 1